MSNVQSRIDQINKQMVLVAVMEAPGSLLFGLALYGTFVGFGDGFLPFLQNPMLINAMFGFGGVIMGWGMYKTIRLAAEKKRILSEAE
ncbi:hypothetical protein [Shewanella maritima]|uniref:hypothetical protein n=1 Tax=Shewanella maritima TaxID=2520507 RepID=UPI003734FDE6